MEIVIMPSAAEVGRTAGAAAEIMRLVRAEPDAVLGLATGSSSLGIYAELTRAKNAGEVDFGRVRASRSTSMSAFRPIIRRVMPTSSAPRSSNRSA